MKYFEQKSRYRTTYNFHLYKISTTDKSIETEGRLVVLMSARNEQLMGTAFPFGVMKMF